MLNLVSNITIHVQAILGSEAIVWLFGCTVKAWHRGAHMTLNGKDLCANNLTAKQC